MDDIDRRIVTQIQENFPLVRRPFLQLAESINISEEEYMARTQALLDRGFIRYIKPVLNARAIGYKSLLVGAKVKPEIIDTIAERIGGKKEVTHCYSRKGSLNLWFTYTYESDDEKNTFLESLRYTDGIETVLEFPSEKTYKIGLKLNV